MYMIKDFGDYVICYRGRLYKINFCVFLFLVINTVKFILGLVLKKFKADFGQRAFEAWMSERPTWWGDPYKFKKGDVIVINKRRIPPEIGLGFLNNEFDM